MMTDPVEPGVIDRELERARNQEPEPPQGFVASIMRRVHEVEERRSAWARWRRSARAAKLLPSASVGRGSGGLIMRKIVWAAAAAGAVAIAGFVWFGYPPVGQGTDATIGAAKRFQAAPAPDKS